MGKILVVGKAEREVDPDVCAINIEIKIRSKTSNEASRLSSERCERILAELADLGIKPGDIELGRDRIDTTGRYDSKETMYESEKDLTIRISNNMAMVNIIRDIIEKGYDNISFSVVRSVSNENKIYMELIKEAIKDSRKKAEFLAESIGVKIKGIHSANLSGDEDVFDEAEDEAEDESDESGIDYMQISKMTKAGSAYGLSDQLKSTKVTLQREVRIVWLTDMPEA